MKHVCEVCGSHTVVTRKNARKIATLTGLANGVITLVMRRGTLLPVKTDHQWSGVSSILGLVLTVMEYSAAGIAAGTLLGQKIDKNWFGGCDALCLSCGFMFSDIHQDNQDN